MMLFANPVGEFVNKHPSIQILGLSFLILIGFMLIAEAAHIGHLIVLGNEVGTIPKGYLYFCNYVLFTCRILRSSDEKEHEIRNQGSFIRRVV